MQVTRLIAVLFSLAFVLLPVISSAQSQHPESSGLLMEHGTYEVHLLLHTIGTESYDVREQSDHHLILTTTTATNDRGMKRATVVTLEFDPHSAPLRFKRGAQPYPRDAV
jgi:hypothetical protein